MKSTFLALTVLAVSAWAQPAAPAVPDLRTYLALTDSQVQSLQSIQTQLRTSTRTLMQQIAEKQQTLNADLAAGSSSAATLGQLLLDIQALRKQVADAQSGVRAQALNVLTDAQKTKLQALVDASKLQPAIRQAEAMGLLDGPAVGPGPGPMGGRGMGAQAGGMMAPNGAPGMGRGAGRMGGMRPGGPRR